MSVESSHPSKSGAIIWSARITAVGFVLLILGGNAWLVFGLFGAAIPDWLKVGAVLGVGGVVCGALGFGVNFVWRLAVGSKSLKS